MTSFPWLRLFLVFFPLLWRNGAFFSSSSLLNGRHLFRSWSCSSAQSCMCVVPAGRQPVTGHDRGAAAGHPESASGSSAVHQPGRCGCLGSGRACSVTVVTQPGARLVRTVTQSGQGQKRSNTGTAVTRRSGGDGALEHTMGRDTIVNSLMLVTVGCESAKPVTTYDGDDTRGAKR